MSQKQVKAQKRVFNRQKSKMVNKIMDELLECGFWLRVKIAWRIVKG